MKTVAATVFASSARLVPPCWVTLSAQQVQVSYSMVTLRVSGRVCLRAGAVRRRIRAWSRTRCAPGIARLVGFEPRLLGVSFATGVRISRSSPADSASGRRVFGAAVYVHQTSAEQRLVRCPPQLRTTFGATTLRYDIWRIDDHHRRQSRGPCRSRAGPAGRSRPYCSALR